MPRSNSSGPKINTLASTDVSDQMKFVRKVYSILAVQLTITAGWAAIVMTSGDPKDPVSYEGSLR